MLAKYSLEVSEVIRTFISGTTPDLCIILALYKYLQNILGCKPIEPQNNIKITTILNNVMCKRIQQRPHWYVVDSHSEGPLLIVANDNVHLYLVCIAHSSQDGVQFCMGHCKVVFIQGSQFYFPRCLRMPQSKILSLKFPPSLLVYNWPL